MQKMWGNRLPMKLKTFMWLVCKNTIHAGVTLKKMKWKEDPRCVVCGILEDSTHIFFECVLERFTWGCLREALAGRELPITYKISLIIGYHLKGGRGGVDYGLKLFALAIVLWLLWTTRNKMPIEGVFQKNPTDILFKIRVCIQRWRPRLEQAGDAH
jgi:hypothetical protein